VISIRGNPDPSWAMEVVRCSQYAPMLVIW
jgi:hypothetical protein